MQIRRPIGSGAVLLGGIEQSRFTSNRPILKANPCAYARLQWHLRLWPWLTSPRRRAAR